MKKVEEYLGKTYNCLKIERLSETTLLGHHIVLCTCMCGNKVKSKLRSVVAGSVSSCGRCKSKSKANLPLSHTNVYKAWYEANRDTGAEVCEDWQEFEPFRLWSAGKRVGDTSRLVRLNLSQPYSPDNCVWSFVPRFIRYHRVNPKTGLIAGVGKSSCGKNYYAIWSENFKQKQKTFSINKFGEDEALRLATEYRKQKIKELYDTQCDSK